MATQFAVIGLGRFGSSVARTLAESGAEVLAVDRELELVERIAPSVTQAVCFDATIRSNLDAHAVGQMDGLVVGIGEDFEAMILVTALARELEIPIVVARAYDAVQKRILQMVGATEVVNPEVEMGRRLARSLVRRDVADFVDLPEGYELRELEVSSKREGESLGDYLGRADGPVVAVRLAREVPDEEGEGKHVELVALPEAEQPLLEGDRIALIGARDALDRL